MVNTRQIDGCETHTKDTRKYSDKKGAEMIVNARVQMRNEQGEMYMIKNELLANANVQKVHVLTDQEVMPWLL